MIKKYFLIIAISMFFFNIGESHAQNSRAYLIPKQIYVGDRASLVVPLPASLQNSNDIILTKDDFFSDENYFPADENIDFHKITLERRTAESKLIIEFTPFITGIIAFPEIEIGGEKFSHLTVTVSSLIENTSDRVLSGAAPSLTMPGTALMLYGAIAALVLIILLTVFFILKGRALMRTLNEILKRRRLFAGIRRTEKRLYKEFLRGNDKRPILDKLSDETREFLSVISDSNCRAMTANEFKFLPVNDLIKEEGLSFNKFFRLCDDLRFSGVEIDDNNTMILFENLKKIIDILEKPKEEVNA